MYRKIIFLLALLAAGPLRAELPGVLRWDVERDIDPTYRMIYRSLEKNKFFIVFEPNIGRNLKGFARRWGEDYNRNDLQGIRSMVFCNGWYTNQISNLDPDLLSICPLHVTLYQKGTTTSVLFTRPAHAGQGSAALPLLKELETDVSKAIQEGIRLAGSSGPSVLPPE